MSRLQVGGLALELTLGNIVLLKSFEGDCWGSDGKYHRDVWFVDGDIVFMNDTNKFTDKYYVDGKDLMPLGDKKTQDELLRECELENA